MGDNSKQLPDTYIDEMFGDKKIALSNALCQAREKTSLLESKVEFLGIHKLLSEDKKTKEYFDTEGNPYHVRYVTIRVKEVQEITDLTGNGLYQDMKEIVDALSIKRYIYEDHETGTYTAKPLYRSVSYVTNGGRIEVEYEPDMEREFLALTKNFTEIRLDIAFKFRTLGGFSMYKLFKSEIYKLPDIDLDLPQEDQERMILEYGLNDLRLHLGYVDLNQAAIRKEMAKKTVDLDVIAELEKKPSYKRYNDFERRILQPGQAEIAEISDIYIEKIEKITGSHNRTEGVRFKIQRNLKFYQNEAAKKGKKNKSVKSKEMNDKIITDEEIDDFIDLIRDFIPKEQISTKDCKVIAREAKYNLELVKEQWEIANDQYSQINDISAWMIKAVKTGYKKGNPLKNEKVSASKKENSFNKGMKQRSYIYGDDGFTIIGEIDKDGNECLY